MRDSSRCNQEEACCSCDLGASSCLCFTLRLGSLEDRIKILALVEISRFTDPEGEDQAHPAPSGPSNKGRELLLAKLLFIPSQILPLPNLCRTLDDDGSTLCCCFTLQNIGYLEV